MINAMHGSRSFVRGDGGGVQARRREHSLENVFVCLFFVFFLSHQFILQFTEGVQWFYFRENYIARKEATVRKRYNKVPHLTQDTTWESKIYTFPRNQRGSNIFKGYGVQLFTGRGEGVQMLISIEFHNL